MKDNIELLSLSSRWRIILKCNFDTQKLPVYLPAFYKECLDAWSMLDQSTVSSYEDVVHQVIANGYESGMDGQIVSST